ncbi:glycosyltransferase family 4 protein [Clostridium aestuarii]|uniref:Glycosyltransferase family 4 protein n=1 Tax=Clostridium aestuarii TaxID=338193 RepID=A0ABT4CZH0_9CLOT|nr:glycosyltransferase family 4 protein [Clostridium aestuarii]MCY6484379.1 glycosyltransferase family 4 protein [Clostridium aestuarii]
MENILMLQVLFPNIEKEKNLYSDLAEEFVKQGYNVYVVTIQDYISADVVKKSTFVEEKLGVKVLRVKMPTKYFNTNFIEKGITTELIPYYYKKAIKQFFSNVRFNLIVPISIIPGMYKIVSYLKKRNPEAKTYLLLRDMFPQMAMNMGVLPKPMYYYFRYQQIKLYNLADKIGCMSAGNIEYVKVNLPEVDSKKLCYLPNWRTIRERKENTIDFKKEYGLEGKIVAIFGGVLGIQQGLDFLLKLANEIKDEYPKLHFLLIGNGTEKEKLKKYVIEKQLHNVTIIDRIPSQKYEAALQQCDIGLINLDGDLKVPHIPSKTLSYLEAGLPILACVDAHTDYGKLLEEEYKSGKCSLYGDLKSYKNNLIYMIDKQGRKKMSENGNEYLRNNLTTNHIVKKLLGSL